LYIHMCLDQMIDSLIVAENASFNFDAFLRGK
jgi:hypothetical protein